MQDEELLEEILEEITKIGYFEKAKKHMQHGTTSVYDHSVAVAKESIRLANKYELTEHKRELIRGALLHDYFLYDWHDKDGGVHDLHGFRHPYFALKNAERDFNLTNREKDIIVRHMFPLVPVAPRCKEAWIVCLADKRVSFYETVRRK